MASILKMFFFYFHLCGLTDKVVREIAMVDRAQQIFIYKLQVGCECIDIEVTVKYFIRLHLSCSEM